MDATRLKLLEKAYQKAKGHRHRVKSRFLCEGAKTFTDEDLLELILMFGIPYKDTRGIARELLKTFKTFDKVLDAPVEDLIQVKGLGEKSVLPLKVVHEAARRYLRHKAIGSIYLKSPQEVYDYLKYELQNLDKETLKLICLDARSKVLNIDTLFTGTLSETAIYPREVFFKALERRAHSVILVHNHPSGDPTPSQADLKITEKLVLIGILMNLRVLDHIIVGKQGYYSMAEEGIIQSFETKTLEVLEK